MLSDISAWLPGLGSCTATASPPAPKLGGEPDREGGGKEGKEGKEGNVLETESWTWRRRGLPEESKLSPSFH